MLARTTMAATLTAIAVMTTACGSSSPGPPDSTPQPTSPSNGTAALFIDDFNNGATLDPAKWVTSDRPELISQRDGGLRLLVAQEDTIDGVEATLSPIFAEAYRELAFTMTFPSFGDSGPGGPQVTVRQSSGRNHQFVFGPSNGTLTAAALMCPQATCAQYDDFTEPSTSVEFAQGEVVPVRIVQTEGVVRMFFRDQLVGESGLDDVSPLTEFVVGLYGADGESWEVVLDDLRVN